MIPVWRGRLIPALLLFIGFDLLGEWMRQRLALPLPGPLIGLVLLTLLLFFRPRLATKNIRAGARVLLIGMSMFFVPAGTGVITQMRQIREQWAPIVVGLCISTIASLLITDGTMRLLDAALVRWRGKGTA